MIKLKGAKVAIGADPLTCREDEQEGDSRKKFDLIAATDFSTITRRAEETIKRGEERNAITTCV